ncbi:alpha/beta hydrolase family protein [Nocardia sp. NPDC059240]|uniref:alpha/beta hydrolase family protein n=1 Tax=Nocardia sp. NPDC059240 TaxID=3346786 RepID=UPI00368AB6BA
MNESPSDTNPVAVASVAPVALDAPGRAVDLQLRVSAPVTGNDLPIVLLSHGLGHSGHLSSLDGYAPLAHYWAARGFVVIQPTHLDSMTLADHPALKQPAAQAVPHWRSRAEDMTFILDRLEAIAALVPQLSGRLDPSRVAVAGHSMGGHTAGLLLGASLIDPAGGNPVSLAEPRIAAGILFAAPGRGDAVTDFVSQHYPFLATSDFATMTTPALVVAGDKDASPHLTAAGPDWHVDAYTFAPGPKSLLTLYGAEHGLGGISGYDVAETTDENPERVATLQRVTLAYLRSALTGDDSDWTRTRAEMADGSHPIGRIDSK